MEIKITKGNIEKMFEVARDQARRAELAEEVPVGAVVSDAFGNILGFGHNDVLKYIDPFAHAERQALKRALKEKSLLMLPNSVLVVTLEPCLMCLGTALKAGVKEIYYSVRSPLDGAFTKYQLDNIINSHFIPNEEDRKRITDFFQMIRKWQKGVE